MPDSSLLSSPRALCANLSGTVLEIGAGRGANFPFLPPGVRWIGLEPDVSLHRSLRQAAAARRQTAPIIAGVAEEIPLADSCGAAVLATRVLCSVGEPQQVLREIRRVLRPGGCFIFLEHVAGQRGSCLRRLQVLAAPLSRRLDHGCDPGRDTAETI